MKTSEYTTFITTSKATDATAKATKAVSEKAGVEDPGPLIGGLVGGGVVLLSAALGFYCLCCRSKTVQQPAQMMPMQPLQGFAPTTQGGGGGGQGNFCVS